MKFTVACARLTPCRYGRSTGTPSESGLSLDAEAALSFVMQREDLAQSKIILFGRSLGGAVAARLAYRAQQKVTGLILENTFTSIPDMIDVVMPLFKPFKRIVTNQWKTINMIENITVPILFISGLADEV